MLVVKWGKKCASPDRNTSAIFAPSSAQEHEDVWMPDEHAGAKKLREALQQQLADDVLLQAMSFARDWNFFQGTNGCCCEGFGQ